VQLQKRKALNWLTYNNVLNVKARSVYKPAVLPTSLAKADSPMQLNWVTVLAVIILVAGVGYLIMRRRRR
jgi:hypothetical protein